MQNLIKKFRHSSIAFDEPVFLSEEFRTLMGSNYHRV